MAKLIWEEYGMSLEEYAKSFNKALDEAWERAVKGKVYFINLIDDKPRCGVIINIEEEE